MGKEETKKDDRPWYQRTGIWTPPEDKQEGDSTGADAESSGNRGPSNVVAGPIQPTQAVPGSTKPEWEKYFAEVREKANLPGPDYKELAETYNDYSADVPDEGQRMKMAFKGFQKMGMTKGQLIEHANHYKQLFAEKKVAFDDRVNAEIQNGLGSMQQEADGLKQKNIDIDKQIQELTQQKVKNDERAIALTTEISSKSATLNSKKADFDATYRNIVAEIDHHLELINKHIQ